VLNVIGALVFGILGGFQLAPHLRHRFPHWRRRAGRSRPHWPNGHSMKAAARRVDPAISLRYQQGRNVRRARCPAMVKLLQ
jgi:hypothetical protein